LISLSLKKASKAVRQKTKVFDLNYGAVQAGFNYAQEKLVSRIRSSSRRWTNRRQNHH